MGEFAAEKIERLSEQRLEVGRAADVAAVGDSGIFGFENKAEGLEALWIFFLKMFTQSFEVRGGVRSDFYWADLQWLVGRDRGEVELGGHQFAENKRSIQHSAHGLEAFGGHMHG